MNRGDKSSVEDISALSKEIDQYGYHSILLVYHSKMPDNFIKVARALSKNEKIKYMLAVRTYAISPEYMAMMCKSFDEIANNRLMLNIVSGDIHKDENTIGDLVMISELLDTSEKRLIYTKKWMDKFLNIKDFECKPEIVMSGHSDSTRSMAIEYGATHLSMYDMHKQYVQQEFPIINKKQMISLSFVVRKTQEEADLFFKSLKDNEKLWTICGNEKTIKDFIEEMAKLGVTDILISGNLNDGQHILVHDIIKQIVEESNGIV
jgi:alkanesulfonate monooxygenase